MAKVVEGVAAAHGMVVASVSPEERAPVAPEVEASGQKRKLEQGLDAYSQLIKKPKPLPPYLRRLCRRSGPPDPVLQNLFSFGETEQSVGTSSSSSGGGGALKESAQCPETSREEPQKPPPQRHPLPPPPPPRPPARQDGADCRGVRSMDWKPIGENAGWSYVLSDERRQCFAAHMPAALSADASKRLMHEARCAEWLQPHGRHGLIPRKTQWMVKEPCACHYLYGGLRVQPQPFSKWVQEAMELCMPLCGLPDPRSWPNSCNLNLYEDGSHSVAWHADDERLFQGKVRSCTIISLSLGHTRSFLLKPRLSFGRPLRMRLASGDLCTMEGLTQKYYVHRVPKEYADGVGPRVNLTWRWIERHCRGCPLAQCEGVGARPGGPRGRRVLRDGGALGARRMRSGEEVA